MGDPMADVQAKLDDIVANGIPRTVAKLTATEASVKLLVAEHRELEAIVRDLAARGDDAVVDVDPEYGNYICVDCPDDWCEDHIFNERDDVQHSEDCLTRRAQAWVKNHAG